MRSKFLPIIFCLFFSILYAFAQTNEARKVDEFGNITCEDAKARLDNWANKVGEDSKLFGYAIIYEGKYSKIVYDSNGKTKLKAILPVFGESVFRTHLMQKYISRFRKIPPNKFVFIDGGFRENFEVEFWLVPDGTNPPKQTPTLETMKYRKGILKYICEE